MTQKDDLVYVRQMIDHAAKAVAKLAGKTRDDLENDEDLRFVVLHLVQIVGEAARHTCPAFQQAHPHIPWKRHHRYAAQDRARLSRHQSSHPLGRRPN